MIDATYSSAVSRNAPDSEDATVVEWNVAFHREQADEYDGTHTVAPFVVDLFRGVINEGDRVLDLGTGTGAVSQVLPTDDVVGVDLSRAMLLKADDSLPVIHGLADALPFSDDSFDVVVGRSVLHHLPDLPAVYRECRRVLRSGGRFVVANEPTPSPLSARLLARLRGRLGAWLDRHEGWKVEMASRLGTDPVTLTQRVNVHEGCGIDPSALDAIFRREARIEYQKGGETKLAYVGRADDPDAETDGLAVANLDGHAA